MTSKMDSVYAHLWETAQGKAFALLDQSLNPRPPRMLYDLVGAAGINSEHLILDVGCGQGNHAFDLRRQYKCHVIGIDPIIGNLQAAKRLAKFEQLYTPNVPLNVSFQLALIEALPLADCSADFIWCRDMLVHVAALEQGIRECSRVLKPGGAMLVLHTFATDSITPQELAEVCEPIGVQIANLSPEYLEAVFERSGFSLETREIIGGEFIEHLDERDGRYSKEVLRIARMVRARDRLRAELGETAYDVALALYRWSLYLLLGKLSMAIYILRKLA